ncbi:MAG: ATP-binding protein [Selenomonas sp.]|nr:ATP-binding protein [Selenomonas sp.]
MLVQFSVTNYKSIRSQATISCRASSDKEMAENLFEAGKVKLVPCLAVYGANASGKSNLLNALLLMKQMVCGSYARVLKGDRLPYEPFSFSEAKSAPTELDIIFYMNGIKYAYGFAYDGDSIKSEYLYHWPRGREALIFSREGNEFTFPKESMQEQNQLAKRTAPNRLYLVTSNEWNNPLTENAFMWFVTRLLNAHDEDNLYTTSIEAVLQGNDSKSRLLQEMMTADLGLENSEVIERGGKKQIVTYHRIGDGTKGNEVYALLLEQESAGTQFFFSRIGLWLKALSQGGVIAIDEIETSLHPLLTRHLVEMVQDHNINRNHAQLIFTTHDVGLLERTLLRRDQIWFVEKNDKSLESEVFALTEFSPRKTENIAKGYLQGRYGAIPFIGEELLWRD